MIHSGHAIFLKYFLCLFGILRHNVRRNRLWNIGPATTTLKVARNLHQERLRISRVPSELDSYASS